MEVLKKTNNIFSDKYGNWQLRKLRAKELYVARKNSKLPSLPCKNNVRIATLVTMLDRNNCQHVFLLSKHTSAHDIYKQSPATAQESPRETQVNLWDTEVAPRRTTISSRTHEYVAVGSRESPRS